MLIEELKMKKLILALTAAAAVGLAAPAFAGTTAITAKTAHGVTAAVHQDLSARHHRHRCRTVIVKKRVGHHWVVRKVRRCHWY
jgi:uncharacterized protein YcfJ